MDPQPKNNAWLYILIGVVIAALISGGSVYLIENKQNTDAKNSLQAQIDTLNTQLAATKKAATDPTANWKTYSNTKYSYSVKYPTDWMLTVFDTGTGAYLRAPGKTTEDIPTITVNFQTRASDDLGMSFQDYVKVAGIHEIQNFKKLDSSKVVTTTSGVVGYETTWDIATLKGADVVSTPIAYFLPKDTTGTVEISLADATYLDVYNNVVTTYVNIAN